MKLYNTKEISELLRVSTNTVKNLLKDNKLKGAKVGKEWRISEKNLNDFLNIEDDTQQDNKDNYKDIDIDSYNIIELIKTINDYEDKQDLKNKIIKLSKEFNYNPSDKNINRIIKRFF